MPSRFSCERKKIVQDFVDVMSSCVLKDSACKRHDQLVNERPRDVLDKEVVGVPSRKVDVKEKH